MSGGGWNDRCGRLKVVVGGGDGGPVWPRQGKGRPVSTVAAAVCVDIPKQRALTVVLGALNSSKERVGLPG